MCLLIVRPHSHFIVPPVRPIRPVSHPCLRFPFRFQLPRLRRIRKNTRLRISQPLPQPSGCLPFQSLFPWFPSLSIFCSPSFYAFVLFMHLSGGCGIRTLQPVMFLPSVLPASIVVALHQAPGMRAGCLRAYSRLCTLAVPLLRFIFWALLPQQNAAPLEKTPGHRSRKLCGRELNPRRVTPLYQLSYRTTC